MKKRFLRAQVSEFKIFFSELRRSINSDTSRLPLLELFRRLPSHISSSPHPPTSPPNARPLPMSANVRVRRPASPPPGIAYAGQVTTPRFPHPRQDHDADEKRAAASKGFGPGKTKHYPSGGLNMTSAEWKLLFLVVLVACFVRLFRLSKPSSVV